MYVHTYVSPSVMPMENTVAAVVSDARSCHTNSFRPRSMPKTPPRMHRRKVTPQYVCTAAAPAVVRLPGCPLGCEKGTNAGFLLDCCTSVHLFSRKALLCSGATAGSVSAPLSVFLSVPLPCGLLPLLRLRCRARSAGIDIPGSQTTSIDRIPDLLLSFVFRCMAHSSERPVLVCATCK